MNEAQHNRNARSLASAQAAYDNMTEPPEKHRPPFECKSCGFISHDLYGHPQYCPRCDSDDIVENR